MAEEKQSTGGQDTFEPIPFYGVLDMTTFTTEDRKAATAKPKKQKVTLKQSEPEIAEKAIVKEIVTARTEAMVEELKTNKANTIAQTIQDFSLEKPTTVEHWTKPAEEYTPSDFAAINDPPEPGVVDVASTPRGAHIVRRGFTTIQMAQAFLARLKNPEDCVIVEVREGNGLMIDGPILAHYVIHKSEEM